MYPYDVFLGMDMYEILLVLGFLSALIYFRFWADRIRFGAKLQNPPHHAYQQQHNGNELGGRERIHQGCASIVAANELGQKAPHGIGDQIDGHIVFFTPP